MVYEPWNISLRKGQHEPLISLETFQKIQERFHSSAQIPARKNINDDYPLWGFVTCTCGTPLTACWSQGKIKKYPYYLCHNRDCSHNRKSIPRQKVEGEFEALLKRLEPLSS